GSTWVARSFLEMKIGDLASDLDQPIHLMCNSGARSVFAAFSLKQLGLTHVYSVEGGYVTWKEEGLPIERPKTLSAEEKELYSRHLLIPEIGEQGQIKLKDSRVLLIGAGGLGSPAALYLA